MGKPDGKAYPGKWWTDSNPFASGDMCVRCCTILEEKLETITVQDRRFVTKKFGNVTEVHCFIHAPSNALMNKLRLALLCNYPGHAVYWTDVHGSSCLKFIICERSNEEEMLLMHAQGQLHKAATHGMCSSPFCYPLRVAVRIPTVRIVYSILRYSFHLKKSVHYVIDKLSTLGEDVPEYKWGDMFEQEELYTDIPGIRFLSSLSVDIADRTSKKPFKFAKVKEPPLFEVHSKVKTRAAIVPIRVDRGELYCGVTSDMSTLLSYNLKDHAAVEDWVLGAMLQHFGEFDLPNEPTRLSLVTSLGEPEMDILIFFVDADTCKSGIDFAFLSRYECFAQIKERVDKAILLKLFAVLLD
jgi:hypothetical protein